MESTGSAIALLALPALAIAVAVFFTTRSAVARMLATASVIAAAVFVYYGVQAPGVWSFFHWRWSACVVLFSLCLGVALTAPLLAESWKRRGWPLRLILYLPLFAAAVVFERNVTGTDDSLSSRSLPGRWFRCSDSRSSPPSSRCCWSEWRSGSGWRAGAGSEQGGPIALSLVAALVALALPTVALWLGSMQGLLPFRASPGLLASRP